MVLSETIWRFFARLRRSSSNRSSGSSSGGVAGEDMEGRSGDRVSGTAAGGFMCSARMASSLIMTRAVSIKRKLDEVETGMLESSASSVNSNARARREREAFSGENFRSANQDSEGNFPNAMQGFVRDKVQPGGGELETLVDNENFQIENVNSFASTTSERQAVPIEEPAIEMGNNGLEFNVLVGVEDAETRKLDGVPVEEERVVNSLSNFSREGLLLGEAAVSTESMDVGRGRSSRVLEEASISSIEDLAIKSMDEDMAMSSKPRLQFFVRTFLDGRTIVIHGSASDTVEYVQRQIQLKTGLPMYEQRLIYGGKQLQCDQTLGDCHVVNDAMLNLVARMRSTALPQSWQLINDFVSTIRTMCKMGEEAPNPQRNLTHLQDSIRNQVKEFLKMATKAVSPSEHMQVFQLSGATSALIMLLLARVQSNSECAEESIKLFLSPNDDFLPNHIHIYCAPILLEFCKLLAKSVPSHHLYTVCRNALASLLETIGVAHGSQYFNEAKAETIVQDFSPFVRELAVKLSSNLCCAARPSLAKDKPILTVQHDKCVHDREAQDFTAFVIPLCKAMEAIDSPVASHVNVRKVAHMASCSRADPLMAVDIGSHKWLCAVFRELLHKIDIWLEAVANTIVEPGPSTREDFPFGWAPFLFILKGLHAIAKLSKDDMEDLLSMLNTRRLALNNLIQQSPLHDEHFWLLEHSFLLDFESKRHLVMAMLPEPQEDHDERHEIVVHRSQLLVDSFEPLAYAEADVLQGGISVEFATEEATGPGVLREWFSLICREIFNPANALFLCCPNDRRRFFPNPASGVNPGHLSYFKFCGRVIGLALMHRVQIDMVLARTFFKQLAGLSISWEDTQDADPYLYSSCKKILEMDPDLLDEDLLGLTFVTEVEELGSRKVMELCPGGRDLVVNSKNRHQYVKLLIQCHFVTPVAEQIKCFAQGFSDLLGNSTLQQFLRALEPEDLDLMLYGKGHDLCVQDWKDHTEYHEYTEADNQIIWFWQVVSGMTMEQRRRLIFFSTSLTHLPPEGFSGLPSKFHIHKAHTNLSWLPIAHTCFYQLVLPPYTSFEMMHARLHAITEIHIAEGFGFA